MLYRCNYRPEMHCRCKVVRKQTPTKKSVLCALRMDDHLSSNTMSRQKNFATQKMKTVTLHITLALFSIIFSTNLNLRRYATTNSTSYRRKKIPYMNENGEFIKPESPNGYKFETLILDMIHMLDTCLPFEVERNKEFAPIKNKQVSIPSKVQENFLRKTA